MLTWYEENGKFLGFEDGALAYVVYKTSDDWAFEDVFELEIHNGCESAEQAMAYAEEDYEDKHPWADCEEEEPLSLEEVEEILGDMEFERRREERMGW